MHFVQFHLNLAKLRHLRNILHIANIQHAFYTDIMSPTLIYFYL